MTVIRFSLSSDAGVGAHANSAEQEEVLGRASRAVPNTFQNEFGKRHAACGRLHREQLAGTDPSNYTLHSAQIRSKRRKKNGTHTGKNLRPGPQLTYSPAFFILAHSTCGDSDFFFLTSSRTVQPPRLSDFAALGSSPLASMAHPMLANAC